MIGKQFRQKFAYWSQKLISTFRCIGEWCIVTTTLGWASNRSGVYCQHRYPSLNRSAAILGRPVYSICAFSLSSGIVIGYQNNLTIQFEPQVTNPGGQRKTKLGSILCRNHLLFLLRSQFSDLPVALKAMWNAELQAQQAALSQLKCWIQIQQVQRSPVPPLACFAMTPVSTAVSNKSSSRLRACAYLRDRRSGFSRAAVSRFGTK